MAGAPRFNAHISAVAPTLHGGAQITRLLMFQRQMDDGRWLAVAVGTADNAAHGEVITVGFGATNAEAMADCKNTLLTLGFHEEMLNMRLMWTADGGYAQ